MNNLKKMLVKQLENFELIKRHFVEPKKCLSHIYKRRMGYFPDLDNPKTYSEKIQWLKLYDHNPLYTILVDKYAVKDYVANIIGEEYIIPTLGVWDTFDEIDFDKLPYQFVLKCTHDSGGLIICKDKSRLDIKSTKKKLQKCLRHNYYYDGFEWPYKNVPHRIIAEKYMEDAETKELRDYKFFCFEGEVKWMFIATDRQNREEPYFDFFDMDFNHLHIKQGHPNAPITPAKPLCFELMKELASKLSKGLPQVRVDFYEVDGKVYFGELTFFHHGGWTPFEPEKWDEIFGNEIKLPKKRK